MLWLEVMLLATWVLMLAWWPCCGVQTDCTGCSGNYPDTLSIAIANVGNATHCSSCSDYVGTYVVTLFNAVGDSCDWAVDSMGGHCGTSTERVDLAIRDSDEPFQPYSLYGRVLLRIDPAPILETAVWREDAVSAWDCEAFSAQDLNDFTPSANNICDWRSATFKVTSP